MVHGLCMLCLRVQTDCLTYWYHVLLRCIRNITWRVLQSNTGTYSGYRGLLRVWEEDLCAFSVLSSPASFLLTLMWPYWYSVGIQHDVFFRFLYVGRDRESGLSSNVWCQRRWVICWWPRYFKSVSVHSHPPKCFGNTGYVSKCPYRIKCAS